MEQQKTKRTFVRRAAAAAEQKKSSQLPKATVQKAVSKPILRSAASAVEQKIKAVQKKPAVQKAVSKPAIRRPAANAAEQKTKPVQKKPAVQKAVSKPAIRRGAEPTSNRTPIRTANRTVQKKKIVGKSVSKVAMPCAACMARGACAAKQENPAGEQKQNIEKIISKLTSVPSVLADIQSKNITMEMLMRPPLIQFYCQILNVMSMAFLNCKLDLVHILQNTPNSRLRSSGSLEIKLSGLHGRANIFKDGKIVCQDTREELCSYMAAHECAKLIEKLGYETRFEGFQVLNIIASYTFPRRVNLYKLASSMKGFAVYEEEKDVGLVCNMEDPKVRINIFDTGKVLLTGARSVQEIKDAVLKIYHIMIRNG